MKPTDYAPRAALFDTFLRTGLVGAEIGVDVGAHAQALLQYCGVAHLTLIDPWPNAWCRGYCEGRLASHGYGARYTAWQITSVAGAVRMSSTPVDFVYIDQIHEGPSVRADLDAWWPVVKPGGLIGYRNYTGRGSALDIAVDTFISQHRAKITAHKFDGEIVLVKAG